MKYRFVTPNYIDEVFGVINHPSSYLSRDVRAKALSPSLDKSNNIVEFFQIAQFKSPCTNKHHVRRYIINEDSNTLNLMEYHVSDSVYTKLIHELPIHKYRVYDTLNLYDIESPSASDIIISESELMN